jgi:hypothetical protein
MDQKQALKERTEFFDRHRSHRLSQTQRTGLPRQLHSSWALLYAAEIADFDDRGLWSHQDVWFSRYGTLLAAVEIFVNQSL